MHLQGVEFVRVKSTHWSQGDSRSMNDSQSWSGWSLQVKFDEQPEVQALGQDLQVEELPYWAGPQAERPD